ncbi:MAG: DEAD/DEAH box helicase [Pseudomonadales bacterium]
MSFDSLGLSAELLHAVADTGYSVPTPIQAQAIPLILEGRDIMAGAQTGTGKTAGFTLPILQHLTRSAHEGGKRNARALILVPTRELAAQVQESVETYGRHLPLKSAAIFGGVNINPQISKIRHGLDVLVATPGRLLDHVSQKTLDLSGVEVLVLDEADRMLDMGFIRDIRRIIALLPKKRQNLMFSATFSREIKQLAASILVNPALVEVHSNDTAEGIAQVVHLVDNNRKRELLSHMIGSQNWSQVLIFCRTKHGSNRLAQQLERDGIKTAAIHGNKTQGARTKALADFKQGKVTALVATDIAARGLDIDQLPHVVNYELPNIAEDYVHRIGRTGRAGREGIAISLVCAEELKYLKAIERLLHRDLPRSVIEGYAPDKAFTIDRPAGERKQTPAKGGGRRGMRNGAPGSLSRSRRYG